MSDPPITSPPLLASVTSPPTKPTAPTGLDASTTSIGSFHSNGSSPAGWHHTQGQAPSGARGPPPPFSLADAERFQQLQQQQQQQQTVPGTGQRLGTDPAKYKTAMCRNWEQFGACSFRGCSFAHGLDELRPVMKTPTTSPAQHPAATGNTPMMSSAAGPNLGGSYTQLPPANVATAHNSALTATGNQRLDHLIEVLATEARKAREATAHYAEISRAVENSLRREQAHRADDAQRIHDLEQKVATMAQQIKDREDVLSALAFAANNGGAANTTTSNTAVHTTSNRSESSSQHHSTSSGGGVTPVDAADEPAHGPLHDDHPRRKEGEPLSDRDVQNLLSTLKLNA